MGYLPQLGVHFPLPSFSAVPVLRRYILLASVSAETPAILSDLLAQAGVSEPVVSVPSDVQAVGTLHQPDREPPVAVFVDVPGLTDATRLIAWIISSPTTRLIPVFAIVGPSGPDRAEIEIYKPTSVISHPLTLTDISNCVELSPLLRGKAPEEPAEGGAGPSPPFPSILAL